MLSLRRTGGALALLLLLLFLLSLPVQAQESPGSLARFNDVRGHWAETFIRIMWYAGVLDVPEDGRFRPDEPVTRADFTFWLARALELSPVAGAGEPGFDAPFTDWEAIPEEQRGHIAAAHAAGLISGYPDGTFGPEGSITRLEIGTLLGRSLMELDLTPKQLFFLQFADGETIPEWGLPAALPVEKLIIIGTPKDGAMHFDPHGTTTRAQAITMVERFTRVRLEITGLPRPEPRPVAPVGKIFAGYYINQDVAYEVLQRHGSALDWLVYWGNELDAAGHIQGTDSPRTLAWAAGNGRPLIALLANHTREANSRLLNNRGAWETAVRELEDLLAKGYSGINVDFEDVPVEDGPALTEFVCTLYRRLKPQGHHISLSLPAKTTDAGNSWSGAFDYAELGRCADHVVIMTYDFSWAGGSPGPVGPLGWMKRVMEYAATRIPKEKLLLGLPAYGYDWPVDGGRGRALTTRTIQSLLAAQGIAAEYHPEHGESTFTYVDEEGIRRVVWFTPPEGVAAKLALVEELDLAGVAMWRLGQEMEGYWPHLRRINGR